MICPEQLCKITGITQEQVDSVQLLLQQCAFTVNISQEQILSEECALGFLSSWCVLLGFVCWEKILSALS
jgi:hypothetical protein